MPGVSRTSQDTAGGTIIGVLAPSVFVNGSPISVVGDPVQSHGIGAHSSPTMSTGSSTVFAHNKKVCRAGDVATCFHAATGSGNVFAGG